MYSVTTISDQQYIPQPLLWKTCEVYTEPSHLTKQILFLKSVQRFYAGSCQDPLVPEVTAATFAKSFSDQISSPPYVFESCRNCVVAQGVEEQEASGRDLEQLQHQATANNPFHKIYIFTTLSPFQACHKRVYCPGASVTGPHRKRFQYLEQLQHHTTHSIIPCQFFRLSIFQY